MRKLITISLLAIKLVLYSQNLITNPSFEDSVSCPDSWSQLTRAENWNININTCDYYHKCSGSNTCSVPNNFFGYQTPYSIGCEAYAGFYAFNEMMINVEYLGQELSSPLTIGQKYYLSFYVSPTLKKDFFINCMVNKIGALFTNNYYGDSLMFPPPFMYDTPHVYTNNVITDTSVWTNIFGSFTADSAYQFIIIGRFMDISQLDTICFDSTSLKRAYYYIDDVCLSTDSIYCANYIHNCEPATNQIVDEYSVRIIPNPIKNKGIVVFDNQNNEFFSAELYDINGMKVRSHSIIRSDSFEITKGNLKSGLYILRLYSNKTKPIIRKILIN